MNLQKLEKQNKDYLSKMFKQNMKILKIVSKFSPDFKSLKANYKDLLKEIHSNL